MQNKSQYRLKALLTYVSVAILINFCGCCFPGTETTIHDNGTILWQGTFPHDLNKREQVARNDSILVSVELNKHHTGNIETRNRNLLLVFVDPKGNEFNLWKYVDYGAVTKVTFSPNSKILRIYFDRAIIGIRNKYYVTEFNLNTMKRNTILIKCGEWYI